jgi:hypothetical protein
MNFAILGGHVRPEVPTYANPTPSFAILLGQLQDLADGRVRSDDKMKSDPIFPHRADPMTDYSGEISWSSNNAD